jgi:hypothetical protein
VISKIIFSKSAKDPFFRYIYTLYMYQLIVISANVYIHRGSRGHDGMVVGFTICIYINI